MPEPIEPPARILEGDSGANTIPVEVTNEEVSGRSAREGRSGLKLYTANEFDLFDFPPRRFLLEPLILQKSLSMVYAPRGCGKTLFSIGLGWAIATGGRFLRWTAEEPNPVLYVDGEMPAEDMQERLRNLGKSQGVKNDREGMFQIASWDAQGPEGSPPDLSTERGRTEIERQLRPGSLVVLDNVSCLLPTVRDNEADSWSPTQAWLLRLRRQGFSVLLVHHSGKSGAQRGTSRREDVLDLSISLARPADYSPEEGARFTLKFPKARHIFGEDVAEIEARYSTKPAGEAGKLEGWTWKPLQDSIAEQAQQLAAEGLPQREIAEQLGVSQSTVCRALKRIKCLT
ncbi:MAG: AAA family ATPase [Acidobacteriota bacterium]